MQMQKHMLYINLCIRKINYLSIRKKNVCLYMHKKYLKTVKGHPLIRKFMLIYLLNINNNYNNMSR
jgi:hypothetical protein